MFSSVFELNLSLTIFLMVIALGSALLAIEYAVVLNERRRSRNAISAYDSAKTELEDKGQALEALKAELETLTAELDTLDKESRAVQRRDNRRHGNSITFIHEIGRNEKGKILYRFTLRRGKTAKRPGAEPAAVMFHASIWRYKNTAEIWAQDPQVASMTLGSIFSPQSGIEVVDLEDDTGTVSDDPQQGEGALMPAGDGAVAVVDRAAVPAIGGDDL